MAAGREGWAAVDAASGAGGDGIHTLGYLRVMGVVAVVVYEKVGLAILRKAWFNLDVVRALALVVTGVVTLVV